MKITPTRINRRPSLPSLIPILSEAVHNPTTDILHIQASPDSPVGQIEIFDIHGRLVKRWHSQDSDSRTFFQFDVSSFISGQYVVRIKTDLTEQVQRFIKI